MSKENQKNCFVCENTTLSSNSLLNKEWIIENWYQGKHGQTLKEVNIGGASKQDKREIMNIVYYCSMKCMYKQQDKEEKEDWQKGKCKKCNVDLVVMSDNCQQLEHRKEMKYLTIQTPECMRPPKKENCWEDTKKWLYGEDFPKEKSEREEIIKNIRRDLALAGNNPPCLDCKDKTLALFKEWEKN